MRSLGTALAIATALFLAACAGEDEADAPAQKSTPEPVAATTTPLSTIDNSNLTAGTTYTTKLFKPNITFTVPSEGEWKLFGSDSPDHIEIEPVVEDPVDLATIGFHHMTQVFPPETGGEIPGDAVPGPDDFAKWLTDHPHLKTTKPKPVEALGLKGVSIDVTVKSAQPKQYKDCGKVEGDCVVMFVSKVETIVYGSTTFGRFYVLEQPDGKELVVEQAVEPGKKAFEAQKPAFDALVQSATVAG